MGPQLEEYITYRKDLGYQVKSTRSYLLTFDRYIKNDMTDIYSFKPSFFLELRKKLHQNSRTINAIFDNLRSFFQFLVRKGCYMENPLQDIPCLSGNYFVPFVFWPEQIDRLLAAICKRFRKTHGYYLRNLSVYMAIFLLARCGLRISEPLRLKLDHYRPGERTLYIEKTKFKKDRLIAIPKSVATEIENYLSVRNALCHDNQSSYLLAGYNRWGLGDSTVRMVFHRAVEDIGLKQPKRTIGSMTFGSPTPHSMRHSFAINTLKSIKDRGKSPQHALPVLSVYMGHRNYKYTGAYLKVSDAGDLQGLLNFVKAQRYSS